MVRISCWMGGMRLTKYPQSCLVVEKNGRILIDPGTIALDAYTIDDFGPLDGVLFTHRHADHFDQRHIEAFVDRGIALYANADVCGLLDGAGRSVRNGESFEIADMEITPRDLPHVALVDGSPGPPNTGYVIDGHLFHPGDGIVLDDLRVDHLALPIVGPSISFRDAYRLVESTGAKRVVPIHYDMFVADPHLFAKLCDIAEVIVLDHGESADL